MTAETMTAGWKPAYPAGNNEEHTTEAHATED